MDRFNELINKLDGYEKQLNELWDSYNPDDPDLKIELTGLKMSQLFYKYIIDCFELINEGFVDLYLAKMRKVLVAISYVCSGVSLVVSPIITAPALLGSIYLSIKRRKDDKNMTPLIGDEQSDILFDKIDHIDDYYVEKTDAIFDRTMLYEDEESISALEDPEKTKRLVGTRLMNAIKGNNRIVIDNKEQANILKEIIQKSLNTDADDLPTLIKQAKIEYDYLTDSMVKLSKKDIKLERINRLFY